MKNLIYGINYFYSQIFSLSDWFFQEEMGSKFESKKS